MVASERCNTQMLADAVWKLLVLIVALHVAGCSVIIEGPSNVTIAEGSNVTLKCRTSLDVTVEWLKSNYTLNLTNPMIKSQYSIDENNSLIIQNVTRIANVRMYECIVRNGSNVQERSQPAWVLVQFVHFSSITTKKTLYIGKTYFRFRVQWLCYPEPHVSWQLPPSITTNRFTFENSSTYVKFAEFYIGDATITTTFANSSEYVGNYTASIDNGFQSHSIVAGILEILDECSQTDQWKCSNGRLCLRDGLHCNNINECGDFSDETTNCSLPEAPVPLTVRHLLYNSIRLSWKFDNMRNVYNITTLIQLLSIQGQVVRSIEDIGGTGYYGNTARIEGLQNDTTYTIVMRTKTLAGVSVNATSINFTIPRMVAPGAPANFSVTGSSTFLGVRVILKYGRPKDDGGSRRLIGYVRKCVVDEPGSITRNCTTDTAYLGGLKAGTKYYYDLQEKTKYYFALYFKSEVGQFGPEVSLFFTTPSRKFQETYNFNSRGLSDAAIAGIVLSCCSVFFAVLGAVCKKMSQSARSEGTSVSYFPPPPAESK